MQTTAGASVPAQQQRLFPPAGRRFDTRFHLPPILCLQRGIAAVQFWFAWIELDLSQRLRQASPLRRQKMT
ncbi:MAG: hypothetical protein KZQ88_02800, partial [Candidatus Thiodiazotropha sp. (ex Dulcina madagascariensis)]|nr:hypothetical protein [Candidatus Thiodiazotropha sp. (ex Dulcina madagascariensis)]